MSEGLRRIADTYIRRAGLIGALYSVVPTLGWFAIAATVLPFRNVYAIRLALSLVVGSAMGAYLNRFGLNLWLLKHSSEKGPATVSDGALIGAAIGLGLTFLPALTAFIGTNHPEEAKAFVIVAYVISAAIGLILGSILAVVGRRVLPAGKDKH